MKFIGENIYIRLLEESDAESLLALQLNNKDFFQLFSPTRKDEYYTLETQTSLIRDSIKHSENGEKYAFGIFLKDTDELIGDISLSGVIHGALENAMMGYALDKNHNGKGYMTEAARLVVKFAFDELKLHRIEAGAMPRNIGSIRVLEKAGFISEGISRKNVKINGKWEDHAFMAIVSEDN